MLLNPRALAIFREIRKDITYQLFYIALREQCWHRAHNDGFLTRPLEFKAQRRKLGAVLINQISFFFTYNNRKGHQHWLTTDSFSIARSLHVFVRNSLVRRMHINKNKSGSIFRKNIDAVKLCNGIAKRWHRDVIGFRKPRNRIFCEHFTVYRHLWVPDPLRPRSPPEEYRRLQGNRSSRDSCETRIRFTRYRFFRAYICQNMVNGPEDKIMDITGFTEPNLTFGWMHVHINQPWVNREKQAINRVSTVIQDICIALLNGMGNHLVPNDAPVNKKELLIRLTA